jgi:epoxyqueuosine reductase
MQAPELIGKIYSELQTQGFNGRVFSIRYLDNLITAIRYQLAKGLLSKDVYKEYELYFGNGVNDLPREACSIIITAAPQPQLRVCFEFSGSRRHFMVPPTYANETDYTAELIITDIINPWKYKLFPIRIPLKLAAVHSGLATYGKNNITYVNGMGSFHRLKAFLSDIPVEDNNWYELKMLKQCKNCIACIKKCPTGAISCSSFIIRQNRCLTFFNERLDKFPPWIQDSWHNCLIGCMHCQTVCPANRQIKNWVEDSVVFGKSETEYFLKGDPEYVSSLIKSKLKRIGLSDEFELLQRNLRILIE